MDTLSTGGSTGQAHPQRPRVKNHLVEVTAVENLTRWYRRVTFDAQGLFEMYDPMPGSYLMLNLMDLDVQRPVQRAYSIHRVTPNSFCMDFVLHTPAGPGSMWGSAAKLGSKLSISEPPYILAVPSVSQALLIADPSAVPGVCSLLEGLDTGITVTVLLIDEHPDHDQITLPMRPSTTITWHPEISADLLRVATASLGPADCFCWAAGERHLAKAVKEFVRHDFVVPRTAQHIQTYWIKEG